MTVQSGTYMKACITPVSRPNPVVNIGSSSAQQSKQVDPWVLTRVKGKLMILPGTLSQKLRWETIEKASVSFWASHMHTHITTTQT